MPATSLAPGTELDRSYRLTQRLGRGGMGEVWEAEHMRLPKRVAVKFLLEAGTDQQEPVARFRREAEIASRLGHPSIVQVFDWNQLPDGTPYLVMERLEGEDLRCRLERGPLPLDEARDIVAQVASALDLAHREGVVHRDLKPENIFLCPEPGGRLRAKVLDFGISKIQGSQTLGTRDDRILGTPGYMAPEQAMGKNSSIDGRTDLFSLATIFYEMVTGRSLFLGDTLAEVVYKVVHHTPEPLDSAKDGVPSGIAEAVQRALSKDIQGRQDSVSTFARALGASPDADSSASSPPTQEVGNSSAPTASVDPMGATVASEDRLLTQPAEAQEKPGFKKGWLAVLAIPLLGLVVWAMQGPTKGVPRGMEGQQSATSGTTADPAPDHGRDGTGSAPPPPPPPPRAAAPVVLPGDAGPPQTPTPASRDAGKAAARPSRPAKARSKRGPALSEPARQKLEQARAALAAKDPAAALRHAKASLYEQKSGAAYGVMARAYCQKRDLGMVRAMLRNLSPAERRRVRKYCKAQGLSLP